MEPEMIQGRGISLRPMDDGDTESIVRWRNSQAVQRRFIWREELTPEAHRRWLNEVVRAGHAVQFIIIENSTGIPIGSVYLRNIDRQNQKAEYGIFIGEPGFYGRGYGTEAAKLVLDYAFGKMALHKVFLRVLAENKEAIKSYQKAEFLMEGVFRKDVYVDGAYQDVVFMAALNPDQG